MNEKTKKQQNAIIGTEGDNLQKTYRFSIRNHVVFGLVMQNEALARKCLERILGRKIKSLTYVEAEKTEEVSATVRGVRYDVYCENDSTVYNIEMQTCNTKALGKQSRYHQDMMDMILLKKGTKYKELKHNIVIFICTFDPFHLGRHIYTFENRCREVPDLTLGDATTKIILNTTGTAKDVPLPLRQFLHYINTDEITDDYTDELEHEVIRVSNDNRWREPIMTLEEIIEDCKYDTTLKVTERVTEEVTERVTEEVTERVTERVTEKVTAEVTAQEKRNTVFRMLENNCDPQIICIAADIGEKELEEYRKEYAASRGE